jgi:hypothetical protein
MPTDNPFQYLSPDIVEKLLERALPLTHIQYVETGEKRILNNRKKNKQKETGKKQHSDHASNLFCQSTVIMHGGPCDLQYQCRRLLHVASRHTTRKV